MQTMNALLRISASRDMTVALQQVTPAEAWLLMHIHDPDTKEVFEDAELSGTVRRTRLEERARLYERYSKHRELIDHLFPGRTAADVPETFAELEDTPLTLAQAGQQERRAAEAREQVEDADETNEFVAVDPAPIDDDELRRQIVGARRKK